MQGGHPRVAAVSTHVSVLLASCTEALPRTPVLFFPIRFTFCCLTTLVPHSRSADHLYVIPGVFVSLFRAVQVSAGDRMHVQVLARAACLAAGVRRVLRDTDHEWYVESMDADAVRCRHSATAAAASSTTALTGSFPPLAPTHSRPGVPLWSARCLRLIGGKGRAPSRSIHDLSVPSRPRRRGTGRGRTLFSPAISSPFAALQQPRSPAPLLRTTSPICPWTSLWSFRRLQLSGGVLMATTTECGCSFCRGSCAGRSTLGQRKGMVALQNVRACTTGEEKVERQRWAPQSNR